MNKLIFRRSNVISALLLVAMVTPINATMCTEVAYELRDAVHENWITWEEYDKIVGRCDGLVESEASK